MPTTDRRILIVDDNRPYREAIRRNLQFMGYDVLESENVSEALDAVRFQQPQVVITDLSMETRTAGLQLIQEIKQRYPFIPIILISAVGTFEEGASAREFGAMAVLGKTQIDQELEVLYSTLDEVFDRLAAITHLRHKVDAYVQSSEGDPQSLLNTLNDLLVAPHLDGMTKQGILSLAEQVRQARQTQQEETAESDTLAQSNDAQLLEQLQQALPGLANLHPETCTMLLTAERIFSAPEFENNQALARNFSFSLSFAVEHEVKLKLGPEIMKFLSTKHPKQDLMKLMYDPQLGNLDLSFSRYLILLLKQEKPSLFTLELVRQTLEKMRKHGERYKPDGLKSLGVILLLFARQYSWLRDEEEMSVSQPIRFEGLTAEDLMELAKQLVSLQHLRNPFVHPEFERQGSMQTLRTAAYSVLDLLAHTQIS